MSEEIIAAIRQRSRPLTPEPTTVRSRVNPLPPKKAVLFDVYGTLIISDSGDVGVAAEHEAKAAEDALAAVGIEAIGRGQQVVERLIATIHEDHERMRQKGGEFPEVDIREIWRTTISSLAEEGVLRLPGSAVASATGKAANSAADTLNVDLLAVVYEGRVNAVWPMPGARETLAAIRSAGLTLGLVSNAQFFTPLLFPALFEQTLDDLGFDPELRFFSYQRRRAKPGTYLYAAAAREMARRGMRPNEALYVGNDMRNDMWPAREVGFTTALFAGDNRSLRLRADDRRLARLCPDLVLTALPQLLEALGIDANASQDHG